MKKQTSLFPLMNLLLSLFLGQIFFFIPHSYALEYQLFSHGDFTKDYSHIIQMIKEGKIHKGDFLAFTKRKFLFDGLVGSGGTTVVVSVNPESNQESNRVLRIPQTPEIRDEVDEWMVDRDYIKAYIKGYKKLKDLAVPVPKVDYEESLNSKNDFGDYEYALVEKLKIDFSWEDLSKDLNEMEKSHLTRSPKLGLENQDIDELKNKMKELIAQTYSLEKIGDLHKGNLVFSNHQWIVLDFTDDIKLFDYDTHVHSPSRTLLSDKMILDNIELPSDWKKEFDDLIRRSRRKEIMLKKAHMASHHESECLNVKKSENQASSLIKTTEKIEHAPETSWWSSLFSGHHH